MLETTSNNRGIYERSLGSKYCDRLFYPAVALGSSTVIISILLKRVYKHLFKVVKLNREVQELV